MMLNQLIYWNRGSNDGDEVSNLVFERTLDIRIYLALVGAEANLVMLR